MCHVHDNISHCNSTDNGYSNILLMMVQNRLFKRLIHLILKFLIFAKVMLLTANLTNVLVIYHLNGLRLIKL